MRTKSKRYKRISRRIGSGTGERTREGAGTGEQRQEQEQEQGQEQEKELACETSETLHSNESISIS